MDKNGLCFAVKLPRNVGEAQEKKQQEMTTTSRIHQKRSTCLKNSVEGKKMPTHCWRTIADWLLFVELSKPHFDGVRPLSRQWLPRKCRLVPCPKFKEIVD